LVALIAAASSVVNFALYFFVLAPLKLTNRHGDVCVGDRGSLWLAEFFLKAGNPLARRGTDALHALMRFERTRGRVAPWRRAENFL
jgi:hypothetical protein